jgi:hypothetical protein
MEKEIRTLFTEDSFTNLCKIGYLKQYHQSIGTFDITFYKHDILSLCKGEIVTKDVNELPYKFMLQDISRTKLKKV